MKGYLNIISCTQIKTSVLVGLMMSRRFLMAVVLVASNVVTAAATIDVNVIVPCSLSIRMVWKRCLTPLTSAYRLWAIITQVNVQISLIMALM